MPFFPPSIESLEQILHVCRKQKRCVRSLRLHAHIQNYGFESHVSLGNCLVCLLVEAGCMVCAHQAFDRLNSRNELAWNALIVGYVKYGAPHLAVTLYHDMQSDDCLHSSGSAFVALLKACVKLKDLKTGMEIHGDIARRGMPRSDLFVVSGLVDMYIKLGSLALAQETFDDLPARDAIVWTSLIVGYVECGCGRKALKCLDRMQLESECPDATTFSCSFKACGSVKDTKKGQELHTKVATTAGEPFGKNVFVGSALVDMYIKCGSMEHAEIVFDKLQERNVVSWTALVAGYVEHGRFEDAINCFRKMQMEGVVADAVTFVCVLKAFGALSAKREAEEVHAEIERCGLLEGNLSVGNALVDMYGKIGALAKAQEVFDTLERHNIDSWNALIGGYVEHGYVEEAVKCFEHMVLDGITPSVTTFVCISKAYTIIGATDKAKEILAKIARTDWREQDFVFGITLIDAYAQCGLFEKAREVFDELPSRNIVAWNALTGGYAEHGRLEEALNCFHQMQLEGVAPDAVTCVCCLKACERKGALEKVEELHTHIERLGLLDRDLVGNTLIHIYAKCGSLKKAQLVFDSLSDRNEVSWTALIGGHAEHGQSEEALLLLDLMQGARVAPDVFTYIHSLKACGDIGDVGKGEEIYIEIARQGMLEKTPVVGNSLLDMYAKCGLLVRAREVFDNLTVRDVVSWNTLLATYTEYGCGETAMKCYEQMQLQGFSPDAITLVCSLKACGSIGAKRKGWEIQAEIERRGLIGKDPFVGTTLVDIYAKWGFLEKAQQVFDTLPVRDVVSWNALLAGYAQYGRSEQVFGFFDRMVGEEGMKPDPVTFVVILSTCRRTGLLAKSHSYFEAMSKEYGISPTSEHQNCMVNVLGHAGHLDKAVSFIRKVPSAPNLEVWHTFLSACRDWGSLELGKQAFEDAVHLDNTDAVAYIMMSHIYADCDGPVGTKELKSFEEASC